MMRDARELEVTGERDELWDGCVIEKKGLSYPPLPVSFDDLAKRIQQKKTSTILVDGLFTLAIQSEPSHLLKIKYSNLMTNWAGQNLERLTL